MVDKYYIRLLQLHKLGFYIPENINDYINNINSILKTCNIGEIEEYYRPRYQIYVKNTHEVLFEIRFNSSEEIDLIWTLNKNYNIINEHHKLLPFIINNFYNITNHHNLLIDTYQTDYKKSLGLFYNRNL